MRPMPWLIVVLLAAALGAGAGCGKKGPPSMPEKGFSAEIRNVSGAWEGSFVRLRGEVSGDSDRMQGVRVYYGAYDPAEPPCESCPVRYHGYHEFGVETLSEGSFSCRVPGKRKDALYFFKVHPLGPAGEPGAASNRVRVDPVSS